ncbi:MAG: hypothetical protein AAFN93_19525 [Bacteroidota bacterium]
MAKRKNPLQDIDAFLSQEATNLVTPNQVTSENVEKPVANPAPKPSELKVEGDIEELLISWAKEQGEAFQESFYDLMLKTLEGASQNTSKDKMLINTLLYLKNPDSWKDEIKAYWK